MHFIISRVLSCIGVIALAISHDPAKINLFSAATAPEEKSFSAKTRFRTTTATAATAEATRTAVKPTTPAPPAQIETGVHNKRKPNILLILADDLGYADTSVWPFTGSGILTPNLARMAQKGTIMTNFHTAAATCTPSRASILTGLFPWRLGIKGVFEYGAKDKPGGNKTSNRDDWLPPLPTSALTFKSANYTTIHSGKWHLGGMRNDDIDMRRLSAEPRTAGSRRCPHPGPNQQGFMHYVSMLDGPAAPRQNYLQVRKKLYSEGCRYLIENDVDVEPTAKDNGRSRINDKSKNTKPKNDQEATIHSLSVCEAEYAIKLMNNSVSKGVPFFAQVWFHAPHGPWEALPGYNKLYPSRGGDKKSKKNPAYAKGNTKQIQYRSMVTDMDRAIGIILDSLQEMNIERDTLVVFLSDNGPEDGTSTGSKLRGQKRDLYEGGVRVPAIFQWVDTIPAGNSISTFAVGTDLFPTFLDASGIEKPSNVRLDGVSFLPVLTAEKGSMQEKKARGRLTQRIVVWTNDYEGPRRTAGWAFNFKLILDQNELPFEMFDLLKDPEEKVNLLADSAVKEQVLQYAHRSIKDGMLYDVPISGNAWGQRVDLFTNTTTSNDMISREKLSRCPTRNTKHLPSLPTPAQVPRGGGRESRALHTAIAQGMFPTLFLFHTHGDAAYKLFLQRSPGAHYEPSYGSDNPPVRHPHLFRNLPKGFVENSKQNLMKKSCAPVDCVCRDNIGGGGGRALRVTEQPSLPFEHDAFYDSCLNASTFSLLSWRVLAPSAAFDASRLLLVE